MRELTLWRMTGSNRYPATQQFSVIGSTLVDDIDFDWANQWRWFKSKSGYVRRLEAGVQVTLHVEIFKRKGGHTYQDETVDHHSRRRLDNRRRNLRPATRADQMANSRYRTGSGIPNVRWDGRTRRWQVAVARGKKIFKKTFKRKTDAVRVARLKRKEFHKEFA